SAPPLEESLERRATRASCLFLWMTLVFISKLRDACTVDASNRIAMELTSGRCWRGRSIGRCPSTYAERARKKDRTALQSPSLKPNAGDSNHKVGQRKDLKRVVLKKNLDSHEMRA